jgi:hypothetical protein
LTASVACGGSSPTAGPSAPTYISYTDTFSDGTLQQNSDQNSPDFGPAGSPHRFTIHQASATYPGSIDVTITSMSPLSTITVGIGLTTWNTTSQSCDMPLQLTTPSAKVGLTISGQVGAPGDLCVAIFDVGNVLGSTAYSITVVHS